MNSASAKRTGARRRMAVHPKTPGRSARPFQSSSPWTVRSTHRHDGAAHRLVESPPVGRRDDDEQEEAEEDERLPLHAAGGEHGPDEVDQIDAARGRSEPPRRTEREGENEKAEAAVQGEQRGQGAGQGTRPHPCESHGGGRECDAPEGEHALGVEQLRGAGGHPRWRGAGHGRENTPGGPVSKRDGQQTSWVAVVSRRIAARDLGWTLVRCVGAAGTRTLVASLVIEAARGRRGRRYGAPTRLTTVRFRTKRDVAARDDRESILVARTWHRRDLRLRGAWEPKTSNAGLTGRSASGPRVIARLR